jgi:hypothetical protein
MELWITKLPEGVKSNTWSLVHLLTQKQEAIGLIPAK